MQKLLFSVLILMILTSPVFAEHRSCGYHQSRVCRYSHSYHRGYHSDNHYRGYVAVWNNPQPVNLDIRVGDSKKRVSMAYGEPDARWRNEFNYDVWQYGTHRLIFKNGALKDVK